MDFDLDDTGPGAGRWVIPLSQRWTAVVLEPVPQVFAAGLFGDGELVETLDEPEAVLPLVMGLVLRRSGARRAVPVSMCVVPRRAVRR